MRQFSERHYHRHNLADYNAMRGWQPTYWPPRGYLSRRAVTALIVQTQKETK